MRIGSAIVLAGVFLLGLSACGPSQQETWQQQLTMLSNDADTAVKRLASRIDNGLVSNTRLLTTYARIVKQTRPEAAELIDALAEDATTNGPIYKNLVLRQQEAKSDITAAIGAGELRVNRLTSEFLAITQAASPILYNMMLTDPINVLADMSQKQLARVESLSADATNQLVDGENSAIGNQMIGNPNYGEWKTQSNGTSFWEFYGQYALISQLFGRGPMSYGGWANNRPYSYYHDYGRGTYTSPKQRSAQDNLQKKTASKFNKQGKQFKSPYAQKRATTAGVASKTSSAKRAFKSNYAAKRSPSAYSGSVRNGSSYSSRSFRGGK